MLKRGQIFGRWTVVGAAEKYPKYTYRLRCACGRRAIRYGSALVRGSSKGCRSCHIRDNNFVHGMCGTPEYIAYLGAKNRCSNTNEVGYQWYGARGIRFEFTSFEQWFAELGMRPPGKYSVDRIDVDGNYAPGNVRWATDKQQANNRRPRRKRVAIS